MDTFMNTGFLAYSSQKWTDHPSFRLATDVNREAMTILKTQGKNMGTISKGEQERLIFAMSLRGVEIFQAVVLMAERGMVAEMAILTRSLLETLFKAGAASTSSENTSRILIDDKIERRKQLKRISKLNQYLTDIDRKQFEAELKHLDDLLKGQPKNALSIESLAGNDHKDFYDLFYSYFSTAAHSSPRHLRQHIDILKDQNMIRFTFKPRFQDVPFFLAMAIRVHLKLLRVVTSFFVIQDFPLDLLDQRLKELKPTVSQPSL